MSVEIKGNCIEKYLLKTNNDDSKYKFCIRDRLYVDNGNIYTYCSKSGYEGTIYLNKNDGEYIGIMGKDYNGDGSDLREHRILCEIDGNEMFVYVLFNEQNYKVVGFGKEIEGIDNRKIKDIQMDSKYLYIIKNDRIDIYLRQSKDLKKMECYKYQNKEFLALCMDNNMLYVLFHNKLTENKEIIMINKETRTKVKKIILTIPRLGNFYNKINNSKVSVKQEEFITNKNYGMILNGEQLIISFNILMDGYLIMVDTNEKYQNMKRQNFLIFDMMMYNKMLYVIGENRLVCKLK